MIFYNCLRCISADK